jgi:NifU-like protein involved in Fe-S cluster formation
MLYSSTVLKHFTNPSNAGRLEDANAVGQAGTPGQGNYLVLHLRIAGDRVVKATFQSYGCPGAIASGSVTTELVAGKTVEEAATISPRTILDALDGLPLGRAHCAELAAAALKDALGHYIRG